MSSQSISVETINNEENTYNAYISYSLKEDCDPECAIINNFQNEKIVLKDFYKFDERFYYVYEMKGLHMLKEYKYQCNFENSEIFKLRFPNSKEIATVSVISILPNKEEAKLSLNYLVNNYKKYDAVISLGDMVSEQEGNELNDFINPISSKVPFMINADVCENEKKNEYFIKSFHMPSKEITKNLYYSFDINMAHFVSIPSEFLIKQSATEGNDIDSFLSWIKEDLSKTKKKWKIVYMNKPLYCSDVDNIICTDEAEKLRDVIEEILQESKVDFVISAGLNNYERLLPIFKSQTDKDSINEDKNLYNNPKFPVFLICGSASSIESNKEIYSPDINFSAKTENANGYCEIQISEDEIKSNFKNTINGDSLDQFSIIKNLANSETSTYDASAKNETHVNSDTNRSNTTESSSEEKLNEKTKANDEDKSKDDKNTNEDKIQEGKQDQTDEEQDEDHEFKQEDEIAINAFYITVTFLSIFLILFIYNVIRCYTRSPVDERPEELKTYSRELQNISAVEDDTVIDLSQAA